MAAFDPQGSVLCARRTEGSRLARARRPVRGRETFLGEGGTPPDRRVGLVANTRETVRRFTLHQFTEAHLVVQNDDEPTRPVNSPKWNYRVTTDALAVIQAYGTDEFHTVLAEHLGELPGLKALYAAARDMERIPVTLPGGVELTLSPGG